MRVRSFRGYRHAIGREREISKIVAPPYDQISPEQQDLLYAMSPANIVRIAWIRDADDVRRAHRIEKILLLGADLIVRGRDDLAEIALAIDRIAVAVERPHAH